MMNTPTLVYLFRHHLWANLRLLDACGELTAEQMAASGGSFGTIGQTLVHLLAAEERYVIQLGGDAPEPTLRERNPFPGFDLLRARAQASGEALIALVERDPTGEILRAERGGKPSHLPGYLLLVQTLHHGNEHRTQVTSLLGRQGIEPPDLSAWTYEEGLSG